MDEDDLSVFDVESAVLNGEIVERQRDRQRREWKYVVNGDVRTALRRGDLKSAARLARVFSLTPVSA